MYGKIFESMYDGTLSADWKAMIVFQQLIVLADRDGQIDYTPPALSRRTGIPLDVIEHGIGKLQEPDQYSRSREMEGRRIALIDEDRPWGWSIVNYSHYRDLASRADKREKDRLRLADKRKSLKSGDVAECREESQPVADVAYVDVDVNTDTDVDIEGDEISLRLQSERRKAPDDFKPSAKAIEIVKSKTNLDDEAIRLATLMFMANTFKSPQWNWEDAWLRWMYRETAYKRATPENASTDPYHAEIQRAAENADNT